MDEKLTVTEGDDWLRFSASQWYYWTRKSTAEVVQIARSALQQGEQVVVTVVSLEAADGMAPNWIWEWLNDKMQQQHLGH